MLGEEGGAVFILVSSWVGSGAGKNGGYRGPGQVWSFILVCLLVLNLSGWIGGHELSWMEPGRAETEKPTEAWWLGSL